MTNKDQIDPVEAAHLSRYSPDGIVLKIGSRDIITGEPIPVVEVSGFADKPLSGTMTVKDAPGSEKANREFMKAIRKAMKTAGKHHSGPMSAQEAAAKAIGDWTARNKPTTPPAKKK